jgi:hypothetical protein
LLALLGVADGLVAAAGTASDGIDEEGDPFGEGKQVLVAAAAMAVKEFVEDLVGGDVALQRVEGLGEGQPTQDLVGEGVLGGILGRAQHHGLSSMS